MQTLVPKIAKRTEKEKLRLHISIRETMANMAEEIIKEDAKRGIVRDYSCAKRIGI